MHNRNISV